MLRRGASAPDAINFPIGHINSLGLQYQNAAHGWKSADRLTPHNGLNSDQLRHVIKVETGHISGSAIPRAIVYRQAAPPNFPPSVIPRQPATHRQKSLCAAGGHRLAPLPKPAAGLTHWWSGTRVHPFTTPPHAMTSLFA